VEVSSPEGLTLGEEHAPHFVAARRTAGINSRLVVVARYLNGAMEDAEILIQRSVSAVLRQKERSFGL
jgi:hypothetical protein